MGRASFDGGAQTFQRQIDGVSARLERLRDPGLAGGGDDLSLSADTPVSRRLSLPSAVVAVGANSNGSAPTSSTTATVSIDVSLID